MVTEIPHNIGKFKMWDKGKMIVILIRTKHARDTIFVGDKNNKISALSTILTRKTQWTDYMEEIIPIITIHFPITYDLNTT